MAEASAIAALCNMPENEEVAPIPATEAQQEVAQTSDTKAEATSTAKASDELSEDALEGAAGGAASIRVGAYNMAWVVELTRIIHDTPN
jgi:hypothetical protein